MTNSGQITCQTRAAKSLVIDIHDGVGDNPRS